MKSNDRQINDSRRILQSLKNTPKLMIPQMRHRMLDDEYIKEIGTISPSSPFPIEEKSYISTKLSELEEQISLIKELVSQKNQALNERIEENCHLKQILESLEREEDKISITNKSLKQCSCGSSCLIF